MKILQAAYDKSRIQQLPRFTFEGNIVVVQNAGFAERAVRALETSPIIGLDTETRPSFRRGVSYKVALLQISTHEVCFLFRLNHIDLTPSLIRLLSNEKILKVGLSLRDDFHQLAARHRFTPQNYIDLQNYAAEMGIRDMSLQKLFANVFEKRISKSAQLSNWEAKELTSAQQTYAATDAYACILLYEELKRLRESGDYRIEEPIEEDDHANASDSNA